MRGVKHVRVWSRGYADFRLELRRNITIVRGNSGSGKTTLVEMVTAYMEDGGAVAVNIESDCDVVVLTNYDWEHRLGRIRDSVVLIDEGAGFVRSHEFAAAATRSSNYFVLFTREDLPQLPYSIDEIYEVATSGRIHKLKPVYKPARGHRYGLPAPNGEDYAILLAEDSRSGYQFYRERLEGSGIECVSADGRSNVYTWLDAHRDGRVFVVADGAAFGPSAALVLDLQRLAPNRITVCLPESFEWLILSSGLIKADDLADVLRNTPDHVDSEAYGSWEQFFTHYLVQVTHDRSLTPDKGFAYDKSSLGAAYLTKGAGDRIMKQIADRNVR